MHDTAMALGRQFFETYAAGRTGLRIVDIGAQDVNGSLRSVAPPGCEYVGLDFSEGRGVNVVISDPYAMPLPDGCADIVVSSSCFEHAEFFWLLFNDLLRLLKPDGLLYINVPSNGDFHRYPVDCWRFYPDSGVALQNWARRSGHAGATLLESFTGAQRSQSWNDFVAVFVKDGAFAAAHPHRMQERYLDFSNGIVLGRSGFANERVHPEDQQLRFGRRLWRKARDGVFEMFNALPQRLQEPVRRWLGMPGTGV